MALGAYGELPGIYLDAWGGSRHPPLFIHTAAQLSALHRPEALAASVSAFIAVLPEATAALRATLPKIKESSRRNFDMLKYSGQRRVIYIYIYIYIYLYIYIVYIYIYIYIYMYIYIYIYMYMFILDSSYHTTATTKAAGHAP